MGQPVCDLFAALPPNRPQTMTLVHGGDFELSQPMEGTIAGALMPEIVRRGLQDLLCRGLCCR
jgi:hypothetical protein